MKLAIVATVLFAGSAFAETSAYMYVPDKLPCTASTTFVSSIPGLPSLEHPYVDTTCMKRQEANAGLRYCSKFPSKCSDQIIMIGDIPLVFQAPNPDSSFWPSNNR